MPGEPTRPARSHTAFGRLARAASQRSRRRAVLTALRSSRQEIQTVVGAGRALARLGEEIGAALLTSERAAPMPTVRRWVARIGRLQVGRIHAARGGDLDSAARRAAQEAPSAPSVRALYRRMRASAFRDPIDLGSLAVDGDDLRRIGIPPGPGLGKILQALLAAVIDDPARNATDWLLQEALQITGRIEGRRVSAAERTRRSRHVLSRATTRGVDLAPIPRQCRWIHLRLRRRSSTPRTSSRMRSASWTCSTRLPSSFRPPSTS